MLDSGSATIRPSVSAAPPGANGATILTGLLGQTCACEGSIATHKRERSTTAMLFILTPITTAAEAWATRPASRVYPSDSAFATASVARLRYGRRPALFSVETMARIAPPLSCPYRKSNPRALSTLLQYVSDRDAVAMNSDYGR